VLLVGAVAGLAAGVTSTGSGTLVIAALAALYPALPASRLVGTDLAQAVPMVLAAALAHTATGDVRLSVTTPLIIGGLPGVVTGSLLASRLRATALKPLLGTAVLASGLALLGLSPLLLVPAVAAAALALLAVTAGSRLRRPPGAGRGRALGVVFGLGALVQPGAQQPQAGGQGTGHPLPLPGQQHVADYPAHQQGQANQQQAPGTGQVGEQ